MPTTARSLAEGHGYRIISLPGSPPQTKYPILFPHLLSLPWLRTIPLAATVIWLWLSWRLLLKCGATRAAAAIIVS